ncbi:DNA-binding NtrC family response regulator [Rhodanobacter sp. ANJX3]|uniref:response regulator n=1 Tax=Rhodanobacter sp. ANJX3 TaxID=2723083 RepID=UPI00161782AE|nr:response regulator [Rhodanobacter sp. ANJX3]MBB5357549.1 DNA-binding NtrC family response regulator [Rhodanobacter sp. ANJX3]
MEKLCVLIVEDHPAVRDSIEWVVEQWPDVEILSAENFISAAIWINTTPRIDLLLADVNLPGQMGGVEIAELALLTYPSIAIVLFSADDVSEIEGMHPAYEFVRKPFGVEQLTRHIDNAFLKLQADSELALSKAMLA